MATILFAEDNDILRRTLARLLDQCGHDVIEARSAEDAVAVLRNGAVVDLVISDVCLAAEADPQVLAEGRRLAAGMPLIYISGFPLEEAMRRHALRPGAAFLAKPFQIHDLLEAIEDQLHPPEDDPDAA